MAAFFELGGLMRRSLLCACVPRLAAVHMFRVRFVSWSAVCVLGRSVPRLVFGCVCDCVCEGA